MSICIICERRPRMPDSRYCNNCEQKLKAEVRIRTAKKPEYFLTYQGIVVGLFRNNGKLTPELLKRGPDRLPQKQTIDLNRYCKGFTREKIKEFKAVCQKLGNHKLEKRRYAG